MNIAILGAGHVAKNLITGLALNHHLTIFSRQYDRVEDLLPNESAALVGVDANRIDTFGSSPYHQAIINCIGAGTPEKLHALGPGIFALTERFDDIVLAYLHQHPSAVYINFSSGAVYGTSDQPFDKNSEFRLDLALIAPSDAYRVAKLNSEAKHRAHASCSIIDLRLFNVFSRHIDLTSSYLMTDIVNAVVGGTELVTDAQDITRDYVHPSDLCQLVERCFRAGPINRAFDAYSGATARKHEILKQFGELFGLKARITAEHTRASVAGARCCYAPHNRDAGDLLGYMPHYTSMDTLLDETVALLEMSPGLAAP